MRKSKMLSQEKYDKRMRILRRILRDFFNESYYEIDQKYFVPHYGNEPSCKLCIIERKYMKEIMNKLRR